MAGGADRNQTKTCRRRTVMRVKKRETQIEQQNRGRKNRDAQVCSSINYVGSQLGGGETAACESLK